jgi:hypothetical protein
MFVFLMLVSSMMVSLCMSVFAAVLMLESCAVAHAVSVLVLVLVYGHEQLLMSGVRSNVHVLSG